MTTRGSGSGLGLGLGLGAGARGSGWTPVCVYIVREKKIYILIQQYRGRQSLAHSPQPEPTAHSPSQQPTANSPQPTANSPSQQPVAPLFPPSFGGPFRLTSKCKCDHCSKSLPYSALFSAKCCILSIFKEGARFPRLVISFWAISGIFSNKERDFRRF